LEKFRKKPVVIEAIRWTGYNTRDVLLAVKPDLGPSEMPPGWWLKQPSAGEFRLVIPTLEGEHEATPGDWIIKGIKGEFYPCKPDIFAATYEPASQVEDRRPRQTIGRHAAR